LIRHDAKRGRRGRIDDVAEPLGAEHGQRRGDAEQHALDVDVDHEFPIVDPQRVER